MNRAIVASLVGAAALIAQVPANAQTATDVDPLADFQTTDNSNDLFGSDGTDASSVFSLIHSLVLSNDTNMTDFNRQRGENIVTEAESFRELQLQRIEQQELGTDAVETDLAE